MESENKNIKVGAFVSLGILALLVTILMLGGNKSFLKSYYILKAEFPQVQGLSVGSVVSLAGVNVGNISEIVFIEEKNKIEISMDIDQSFQRRITKGASVNIKTQGALGDKYIYINPGPMTAEVLNSGDYLLVENQLDLFDMISEEGPKLAAIVDVINELKTLLSNLNHGGASRDLMVNMTSASQKIDKSMSKLDNILDKVDKGQGTLGALINDPSVHNKVMNLLGKSPRDSYLKPLLRSSIKSKDKAKKK